MIAPARLAAYDLLSDVSAGRSDLPTAVARVRQSLDDERDRALAAEIATGVQRRRAALDHLIETFSNRRIDRLDPEVVEILRLSVYQLLYLQRVPAAAVVDDAVDLTKRVGKKSAGGFVNAVLRTVSRKRSTLPLPPRPVDTRDRQAALDYFSITLSHPRWLAVRWLDRLGFDRAERWLQFNNTPAPLTLRANRLAGDRDDLPTHLRQHGVALKRTRYAPDGFIVEEGHPLRDPGAASGWFVVQDEASQLVALLAGPAPGRLILDACASPGGKTTAFAAAATPEARIVACDVRERRIDLLRRTLHNTRTVNVAVVQADLLSPLPFRIPFDCVVVDAPCSGLGTLRRDPDIRWRRRESDLSILAAAELKMLRNAADVVAPGGRLIYATCSSEPEENEMIAGAFVEGAPEFSTIDVRNVHPALDASLVDDRGHLRTTPDLHGLEAFFGAVFERRRR